MTGETGSSDTETGETTGTGDTGAAPCVPMTEIPMNDADDDCDGWADEYGTDWPRITQKTVLLRDNGP